MLAYAATDRRVADRAGSPRALAVVSIGHLVLIGAVLSAKMEVMPASVDPILRIIDIVPAPPPAPQPPPPPQAQPQPRPAPQQSFIEVPPAVIDMGSREIALVIPGPAAVDSGPLIGPAVVPDPPRHVPIKVAAVPRTPESALRPPYPNDKLREEAEATLRLRLSIDARGRVTAVDPLGAADPSFLAAARRHILRAWRYTPATEDGVAVASTIVISLSFRLEDA